MCGRFALTVDIEKIARTFGVEPTLNTVKRYNIAPTQNVVSIVRNGEAHLAELRWGLIPSWAKDESIGSRMINARAESLTEKPSFKGLLRSKRCLIVADGWRFPNLSRAFDQSGMRVIRQRIAQLLEAGGVPTNRSRQVAGEVVALSLGDAYQRAALGIAEESDDEAFAQQIEAAVTHGFGRPA